MSVTIPETYSEEMLLYAKFFRGQMFRRVNDLNRLWNREELAEYPRGTFLHLIDDNFLMNKPIVLVPDTKGWSMTRRPDRKYVMHITQPVPPTILQLEETFQLPPNGVVITITNFKKRNQLLMRPVNELEAFPKEARTDVQSIISYNALYRARIFGQLKGHRRFKYIFTNLINNIGRIATIDPTRRHFIPIPVGDRVFDRNKFMLSFKKYDRSSIKLPEDQWYLFMMHFMGFINKDKTPSLFEAIPERLWEYINFVLYTKNKMLVLNLKLMKELNAKNTVMWRVLNLINLMAEEGHNAAMADFSEAPVVCDTKEDATELLVDAATPFDEKPPITVTTNEPEVKPEEPKQETKPEQKEEPPKVIDETKPQSEPVKTMFSQRPLRLAVSPETTKGKVEAAAKQNETYLDFEPELLTIDPKWLETTIEEGKQNAPKFTETMTKQEQQQSNKELVQEIDNGAKETIENQQNLNENQAKHAEEASQAYKTITLDGESIQEILESVPDDSVADNTLSFLQDDPDIVDKSMLKSSITTFEHDYMTKMFKRDLVMNLTSFNKHGMFLKTVDITDVSDSLNQVMEVKATYEDPNRKIHTIRFKLPKVDNRGYCMVNGTLAVVKKQRVPLPICKLSATTVALTSNYNKYLVTRNVTNAHSFVNYVENIMNKGNANGRVKTMLNSHEWKTTTLPYEYTALAKKYQSITILDPTDDSVQTTFYFNYPERHEFFKNDQLLPEDLETIKAVENDTKSIAVALINKRNIGFIDVNNELTIYNLDEHISTRTSIIDYLCETLGVTPTPLSEWVDFKMLDTTVPVIFALCYKYGLSDILNYTKTEYRIVEAGARTYRKWSDLVIKFADKTLIIPRSPATNSLLFGGLNYYKLDKINMEEMDSKDIYYDLMQSKKRSINFLKGIIDFFDLFVDPITREVLEQMKEPITSKDLLIRATQLLTTEDHNPPSSSSNFRFRSYERINSAVYNVLSRSFAKYRNKNIGANSKWSIADYEIQQLIMQDQLKENVDIINPINDIKYQGEFSHAGFCGGRKSLDTFTVDDRQFPEDGVGIISEATVDSAKTAFAASTSMDPTIVNMRGMTINQDPNTLTPTQMLSVSSLVMPGVTQDD